MCLNFCQDGNVLFLLGHFQNLFIVWACSNKGIKLSEWPLDKAFEDFQFVGWKDQLGFRGCKTWWRNPDLCYWRSRARTQHIYVYNGESIRPLELSSDPHISLLLQVMSKGFSRPASKLTIYGMWCCWAMQGVEGRLLQEGYCEKGHLHLLHCSSWSEPFWYTYVEPRKRPAASLGILSIPLSPNWRHSSGTFRSIVNSIITEIGDWSTDLVVEDNNWTQSSVWMPSISFVPFK